MLSCVYVVLGCSYGLLCVFISCYMFILLCYASDVLIVVFMYAFCAVVSFLVCVFDVFPFYVFFWGVLVLSCWEIAFCDCFLACLNVCFVFVF